MYLTIYIIVCGVLTWVVYCNDKSDVLEHHQLLKSFSSSLLWPLYFACILCLLTIVLLYLLFNLISFILFTLFKAIKLDYILERFVNPRIEERLPTYNAIQLMVIDEETYHEIKDSLLTDKFSYIIITNTEKHSYTFVKNVYEDVEDGLEFHLNDLEDHINKFHREKK